MVAGMDSSVSRSQDTATLSAPKRIRVITTSDNGIEVTLETEPSPSEEAAHKKETSKPVIPAPTLPAASSGIADQSEPYFETEIEDKNACFAISDEEWESIKPRNMPSGGRLLTGPWSHVLSQHLKESNPYCCFAFHYNRLKTENSRKRMAPFFKGIGICKIKECGVTVRLLIRGINEKKRLVDVSYSGKIRHKVNAPVYKGVVRSTEAHGGMMLLGLARDQAKAT